MATAKYWEEETPRVYRDTKMELREFEQAGKLQIYQVKEGTQHGVTKGVTVSMADMSPEELIAFASFFMKALDTNIADMGIENFFERVKNN